MDVWEAMTPQQRREARKNASPPSLDLTLGIRDLLSGSSDSLGAVLAEQICSMVEARGDVNATDSEDGGGGSTVLMFAAQNAANPDILRRLLRAKADPSSSNTAGFTALHALAARPMPDAAAPEMLSALIQAQADPSAGSASGLTPLHVAAVRKSSDMCKLLVAQRADPSAIEVTFQASPLDWAKRQGRLTLEDEHALWSALKC
eukprot:TRINITY_DN11744_c0_g2_i1.p1 TRINITY_DN11744_c0_g2~~TRINITY_DN11744_c0_g2_i1.p1  ORF type:complete len:233 (-),score=62.56 TRINITY_DN11744_c0_g2_i1:215-826(-)